MKIRFIINPTSGKAQRKGLESRIEKLLDLNKFDFDYFYTERAKHATELAQQSVNDKIDVVVAVGGDGTMHECAKALLGSQTALAVLPCGSGNGFAFHFGMERDIDKAIKQLNISNFKTIDS